MPTVTQNDFATTGDWADALATLTGAASVSALYANTGLVPMQVVFGGGSAPSGSKSGVPLAPGDSFEANAANAWVRGAGGKLSVTVL